MPTVESYDSNSTTGNSITITKPTGLSVGDELFAQITAHSNVSGTMSIDTPSGWTLVESTIASTRASMSVFQKTAESADVSASDFTFTTTGGSSPTIAGHVLRVSDYGVVDGESSASEAGTTTTTLTATGFTPDYANCLFLFFGATHTNTGVAQTLTGYAIATDDPTFTEQSEVEAATANFDTDCSFATATRAETTATGTITLTRSSSTSADSNLILLAIAAQADNSKTSDIPDIVSNVQNAVPNLLIESSIDEPITTTVSKTVWTNETKNSTTWTNKDK